MNSEQWRDYKSALAQDLEQADALPFNAYTSPELYEAEQRHIFYTDWVFVCAAQQLQQPGDYYALRLAGEPIAVLRGQDGQLRALSNVCSHRSTPLLDNGFGNISNRIVCPYHAWTYNDQGVLIGLPHSGDIEVNRQSHCLPKFSLDTWHGLVFVCLHEPDVRLEQKLAGLDTYLTKFDLQRFTNGYHSEPQHWSSNWKLAAENGMESYHLFKVHPESLEPYTPTKSAFYVAGCASWTVTAGRFQGALSNLTGLISDNNALNHYLLISIPPGFIGVLTYQSLDWITVLPEPSNRCQVHQGGITDASGLNHRDSTSQAALAFLEEDRVICERAQQGMTARFNRGGKLVELEQVLVDFRRYLLARHFNVTTSQLTVGANSRLFAT